MKTRLIVLALLWFVLFNAQSGCSLFEPTSSEDENYQEGTEGYYLVQLNNGDVSRFKYKGFQLDSSGNVWFKDSNCTKHGIDQDEWTKIIIYGYNWSNCEKDNRWEIKVYYKGTSKGGFAYNWSKSESVTGTDYDTGTYSSIKVENIDYIKLNN